MADAPHRIDDRLDLSEIYPGWHGKRANWLEGPIRRGLHRLRELGRDAEFILNELQLWWDYDGPIEWISRLEFCQTQEQVQAAMNAMIVSTTESALKEHPHWRPIAASSLHPYRPLSQLPGRCLKTATPIAKFAVGAPELYDELHVSYFCFSRSGGNVVERLLTHDSFSIGLSDYLAEVLSQETNAEN